MTYFWYSDDGLELDSLTVFVPTVHELLKEDWAGFLAQCSTNDPPNRFCQSTFIMHPLSKIRHSPVKYLCIVKVEHSQCTHGMNHEIN